MTFQGNNAASENRRRFLRVPAAFPAMITRRGGAVVSALCTDVGLGGFSVQTRARLEPGEPIMLGCDGHPWGDHEFKARVAWRRTDAEGSFAAGLQAYADGPCVHAEMSRLMLAARLQDGGLFVPPEKAALCIRMDCRTPLIEAAAPPG
jgi:hypothetical protein